MAGQNGKGSVLDRQELADLFSVDAVKVACMLCGDKAARVGVISTPCQHPQPLCYDHYLREVPKWSTGDAIWCYLCPPAIDNGGRFQWWDAA